MKCSLTLASRRQTAVVILRFMDKIRSCQAASDSAPWLPSEPGPARCSVNGADAELRNAALRLALTARDGVLAPAAFDNAFTQSPHALAGELFSVTTRDKRRNRRISPLRVLDWG